MKNKKRLSAMVLAAAMTAFSGMAVMAPAAMTADAYNVSISNGSTDEATHKYTAYQVFKGDLKDGTLTNVTWGDAIDQSKVYTNLSSFGTFTTVDDVLSYLTTQEDDSEKMVAFANAIANSLKANAAGVDNVTVAKGATGNLTVDQSGYYLIKEDTSAELDKDPSAYSRFILKVVDDVTVTAKKDVPHIDKKIDKNGGVKANVASIGDTVPYIVNTSVPDMKGYNKYYFIVNDTMDEGLTFDPSSVDITLGGDKLPDTAYTVKTGNDAKPYTFQIVFNNFIQYKYIEYVENASGSYYQLKDGSYTDVDPANAAEKLYDSTEVKYSPKAGSDPVTYVEDENGTYYRLADGSFTDVAPSAAAAELYNSTTQKYDIDNSKKDIVIKYNATLNEKADRTKTGNENTVDLTFSNNPSHTYDGENEPSETEKNDKTVIGKTPESNTKTYTTGIKVVKIDAKTGERLKGAEFQAQGDGLNKVVYTQATSFKEDANGTYYKLKNGTYTDTVPTGSTSKYYDSTTVKYSVTFTESNKTQEKVEGENTVKMITDDTGIATFEGLGNGTYTLKETKAPEGYNLLQDTFSVTLDSAPSLDGPHWTVDGKEVDLDESGLIIKEFVIENNKGVTLPGTGGMGTTLFYVVGGALVAGAGVLFVTKKRMSIKEK